MRLKIGIIGLLCILLLPSYGQKIFKGYLKDIQQNVPLENACIHNISTGVATFSNRNGNFALLLKGHDTLIVTHVGYAMKSIILRDSLYRSEKRISIDMEMKSILLKTANVYALKPYPIFLEDVAQTANNLEKSISLTDVQKADATANPTPHLYSAHPITLLYDKYSRRAKMDRLYAYLSTHEEESNRLQSKYNPEIVSRLSGLEGNDLESFMCYCSFSYYTLVKASDTEIAQMIRSKLEQYRHDR